jgi:hypothetical protein
MAANAANAAAWIVYDYEAFMFKDKWTCCSTGAVKTFPESVKNAIVESALLHLRILVDILLSRGSESDDIKLTDLLPNFQSPLIGQLRNAYGDRKTTDSPCWTLNKMMAHPTQFRSDSHNYDPTLKAMLPAILPLLEEIAQARQR